MRDVDAGVLRLEPQTAAHADAMFAILRDPALYVHEGEPPPSLDYLRQRFARLESRRSGDGSEGWLNWVIRLPDGALAGYVQATLPGDGSATIAYVLGGRYWGRGLAQAAVRAMLVELETHDRIHTFLAVLKAANQPSLQLLLRSGFVTTTPERWPQCDVADDELVAWRPAALFSAAGIAARTLEPRDVARLQAFLEANPTYFRLVNARDPLPTEAQQVFEALPPAHLAFAQRFVLGLFDRHDAQVGVVSLLADFVTAGVWHVGLFILASARHGRGEAGPLYAACESWMRRLGATWVRLGVVVGNARAERFWEKQGFVEVRRRAAVDTGGQLNDIRVLVKSLAGDSVDTYIAAMPRDQPESTLP